MNLDFTLACGQAFRWRKRNDGVWSGVVRDKLIELAMDDGDLLWRTFPSGDVELIKDYLRLGDDVNTIYSTLSINDDHLAEIIEQFHGLRLLRQDPTETLLSFICSAANSIPRIMTAIETIAAEYGRVVCENDGICYHAFPAPEKLANTEPGTLDNIASLGFRGSNLRMVARQIIERGEGWLMSLRSETYTKAKADLLSMRGVGAKIADCVCLFSLDKDEAVPVDTHVRQLAHRLFLPEMKAKTITDAVYRKICEVFTQRYGANAGWAQQFLYYEDLMRSREIRGRSG